MAKILVPIAILLAGLVLVGARRVIRHNRILREQLEAYKRGDYETQMRIVEGFRRRGSEPSRYLFFRGTALFELGDLAGAEGCLRRSIADERVPMLKTLAEDQLGLVLIEQGRHDEAIANFENVIALAPDRAGGHRGMAIALLRQGRQTGDALRHARQAVEIDEAARKAPREDLDLNLAESLAALAWAVAVYAGDAERTESLLEDAFALCPERTRPIRAELHYHAARAYLALDRVDTCQVQLVRAIEADPKGNFGRLAAVEAQRLVSSR